VNGTADARTRELIPRQILFGNPERAAARISPDGRYLAYLAPLNGVLNVWVGSLDGSDAEPITHDTERPIRLYLWRPDGSGIIHLQDRGGDENFHLYSTDLATRVTTDLTPFEGARAEFIAIEQSIPDELLVGINARDPRLFDVHRIDLRTGTSRLELENPGDVVGWIADAQLHIRIAHVMRPDGGTTLRRRVAEDWVSFLEADPEETLHAQGFDDRGRLLVLSSLDANATRLIAYDLDAGTADLLAEDRRYDVSGAMLHPRTHAIEAIAVEGERVQWRDIVPTIADDIARLSQLSHGDWRVTSRDHADRQWIVQFVVDNGPARTYLYDRDTGEGRLLFTNQPALDRYELASMQPIRLTARDGLLLEGYLTLPPDTSGPVPLILLVHGGPWARDSWGYHADVQWLANRGYGVLQINFRGSTGYGKAHLNAGDREWGAKMHDDLLDAKAWAIAEGYADPQRIGIYGGSYGGYATLAALAFTPDEFTCGVDLVGPSNLLTLIASIPPYWAPMLAQFTRRLGDPERDHALLVERSPLTRAAAITAPLLIAQGANDPRVKIAESDQIVEAMRAQGKTVTYLVFDDEGHGFARPENRLRFAAATESFLAAHLGGKMEPASPEEDIASR